MALASRKSYFVQYIFKYFVVGVGVKCCVTSAMRSTSATVAMQRIVFLSGSTVRIVSWFEKGKKKARLDVSMFGNKKDRWQLPFSRASPHLTYTLISDPFEAWTCLVFG